MSPTGIDPTQTQLLAALPKQDLQRWLGNLEPVDMPLGEVPYEIAQMPQTAVCNRHHSLDHGVTEAAENFAWYIAMSAYFINSPASLACTG